MREFILRARKARTSPDLKINELPNEGKLDVVCDTISSAIFLSGDVRRDTVIHAVLEGPTNGPKTVTFIGSDIRGMRHDERSIGTYIISALQKGAYLEKNESMKVRAGVKIAKKSFERLLWERSQRHSQIIFLEEKGKDARDFKFEKNMLVVLGGAEGLPEKTKKLISDIKAEKVSLGPRPLFAAHCPVILHNELDRRNI